MVQSRHQLTPELQQTLPQQAERPSKRILYIGNFQPKSVGEPEIARCLQGEGYEVDKIHEVMATPEKILNLVQRNRYAFVLFAKLKIGGDFDREQLIDGCKRLGVPTVCWVFDLYWGL